MNGEGMPVWEYQAEIFRDLEYQIRGGDYITQYQEEQEDYDEE